MAGLQHLQSDSAPPDRHAALAAEALRLYRRYLNEIVLAFGLCPWAERAIALGKVDEKVILGDVAAAPAKVLKWVAQLAQTPEVEVALILLPEVDLERSAFDRFTQEIREGLASTPYASVFALAAFHPFAEPNRSTSERFIPFLRRTPDPTLQLVRYSSLERVREGTPQGTHFLEIDQLTLASLPTLKEAKTLRERIADNNLAEVERVGVETLQQIFRDIRADRDRSYVTLLGPNWGTTGARPSAT